MLIRGWVVCKRLEQSNTMLYLTARDTWVLGYSIDSSKLFMNKHEAEQIALEKNGYVVADCRSL